MAFEFSGGLALAPGPTPRRGPRLGVAGHLLSVLDACPGLLRPRGRAGRHQRGRPLRLPAQGSVELPLGSGGHVGRWKWSRRGGWRSPLDMRSRRARRPAGPGDADGRLVRAAAACALLGSRHGALAAGIQFDRLRGAGSTVSEPKLRLEFEDNAVSAHCFVEDGRAGSCLQWRPPVLRGLHLTGGCGAPQRRTPPCASTTSRWTKLWSARSCR